MNNKFNKPLSLMIFAASVFAANSALASGASQSFNMSGAWYQSIVFKNTDHTSLGLKAGDSFNISTPAGVYITGTDGSIGSICSTTNANPNNISKCKVTSIGEWTNNLTLGLNAIDSNGAHAHGDVVIGSVAPQTYGSLNISITKQKSAINSVSNTQPHYLLLDANGDTVKQGDLSFGDNLIHDIPATNSGTKYVLKLQNFVDGNIEYDPSISSANEVIVNNKTTSISAVYTSKIVSSEDVSIMVKSIPSQATSTISLNDGDSQDQKSIKVSESGVQHITIPQNGKTWTISASSISGYNAQITPMSFTANQTQFSTNISFSKVTPPQPGNKIMSIFWCGSLNDTCSDQSKGDDVYAKATHVIMAFANTTSDGSIVADNMPTDLISKWHNSGKKVIISVGGQNGRWTPVCKDNTSETNFINSLSNTISKYNLDGVDLDLEADVYQCTPQSIINLINNLKSKISSKQLIVSPELVAIDPDPSVVSQLPKNLTTPISWNMMVPVYTFAGQSIDYVQPQIYNNGYVGGAKPGTAQFLEDAYLGWMNKSVAGLPTINYSLNGKTFNGIPASKLIMGVIASPQAGNSQYYAAPSELSNAIQDLGTKDSTSIGGVMMWDSHWDSLNGNKISSTAASALGLK